MSNLSSYLNTLKNVTICPKTGVFYRAAEAEAVRAGSRGRGGATSATRCCVPTSQAPRRWPQLCAVTVIAAALAKPQPAGSRAQVLETWQFLHTSVPDNSSTASFTLHERALRFLDATFFFLIKRFAAKK